ncbi:MAG: circularly permuted type 2 ATP-grasp protein [Desulfosarcinaceae bacterium]|nr:circularly permuted type 2 ATP-grasp protein [Desulfosarcinaceae bacterium]
MTSNAPMPQRVAPAADSPICHTYAQLPPVYDELWSPDGNIRHPWKRFIGTIETMGCAELRQRHQEIGRQLKENGAAYNIHGDPMGNQRPLELDIIPLIFGPDDWRTISAGLQQRAHLLDLVLQDIYGPGNLLSEGLLPAKLIYSHRGFLRPCWNALPQTRRHLHFYSADLARDTAGVIHLLADRTQAPYGIGHTLENRTAMANVMGDFLRSGKVQRLSSFFRGLQDALAALTPHGHENPLIAIYASAARHRSYFEQAYLGSYLNYPVVQGEDLTVREGQVWLKTLYGLNRVDTLLRMRPDRACDPLELDPTTEGGLPGLLEATRQGHMVVTNGLGSGVLENPGLTPYLPAIAQRLLGQALLLPSPPTWWCGDPEQCAYVLAHIDELIITPTHQAPDTPMGLTLEPQPGDSDGWRQRIAARPHLYTARAPLATATAPAFGENRFVPFPTTLRTFAIATAEDDYTVMPGGIARSTSDPAASPPDGYLKDVWVISEAPQKHISLWMQPSPIGQALKRQAGTPSRTAENLFWVGRYAERAELLARMLRTVLQHFEETSDRESEGGEHCLASLLGVIRQLAPRPDPDGQKAAEGDIRCDDGQVAITIDRHDTVSLMASLDALFTAAQAVRERWSSDTWRVLNDMRGHHQHLGRLAGAHRKLRFALDRLVSSLLAFSGLCMESMSRELGWVLLDTGRRIERSWMLSELIRRTLVGSAEAPVDALMMESVLMTTENIITYRRRYRSFLALNTVLDLLLMDDKNPRSLIFQLDQLQAHIVELPRKRGHYRVRDEERLALEAVTRIRLSDMDHLCETDPETGAHFRLDALLGQVRALLERTSDTISHIYFIHTPKSRQLTNAPPEVDL